MRQVVWGALLIGFFVYLINRTTSGPSHAEFDSLRQELTELKLELGMDQLSRESEGIAYLTPGDGGYSTIRSNVGVLTVSLEDVTPYANGSKVTLQFGNPLAATLNGCTCTVEWGKVDAKGSPDNNSQKTKETTFVEPFKKGAWTTVSIILDGIPPNELGFVRIRHLKHTGIALPKQ